MAKQQIYQQRILKITSDYIIWNNMKVKITAQQARENQYLVPLADSETIRMIDTINDFERNKAINDMASLKQELKIIKKKKKTKETKQEIAKIYTQMDKIQCKMDYVAVVFSSSKDFDIINQGFSINDIEYKRLVGTPNGVKKSTVIYCSVKNEFQKMMYSELSMRFNNGRNEEFKLVPAKFEAHKALTCSASTRVSSPNGILVVDDLITKFKDTIINLSDENSDEPEMTIQENIKVELNSSDGYGLMLPALSERWSKEMGVNYIAGAMCIRDSFCKGVTATYDFIDFNHAYCNSKIVKDVWGDTHNIEDIELILTTSMLKLWDSYKSIEDYLKNCEKNGYSFAITKVYPNRLEEERNLNYQFIQSYDLSEQDIHRLIMPTVSEIKDVLGGDYYKSLLFMKGSVDENYNGKEDNCLIKSLMITQKIMNDEYVVNQINNMIKKKIAEAKIGTLKINGNYCVVIGDPYALCQKIFGLIDEEKDGYDGYGLLQAGEIYNKHWSDKNVNKVVCFRAPMSCHNNIRIENIVTNSEMEYWYQYLPAVNIINCHDSLCHACNGMDCDGDCLITTDNEILLEATRQLPAIMCIQRKAEKKIINEEELRRANLNSFGDTIGSTTNKITAMYDVQARFPKDSKEYKVLDYRIMCGQLYQQNCIDKTKGIIAKPMPPEWYLYSLCKINETNDTQEIKDKKLFNQKIVADKKPYFMNYIYPQQMTQYKKYIKTADRKCRLIFGTSLQDLINRTNKTKQEQNYINWYFNKMPVGIHNCVMNKVCWAVEKEFDGYVTTLKHKKFDYTIYKNGGEYKYQESTKNEIRKLYKSYNTEYQQFVTKAKQTKIENDNISIVKAGLIEKYQRECVKICGIDTELCDILLDICYGENGNKKFVWDMCGQQIVKNLLNGSDNTYTCCIKDNDGSINYAGKKYTAIIKKVEMDSGNNNE